MVTGIMEKLVAAGNQNSTVQLAKTLSNLLEVKKRQLHKFYHPRPLISRTNSVKILHHSSHLVAVSPHQSLPLLDCHSLHVPHD